jgi:hypothetical protein
MGILEFAVPVRAMVPAARSPQWPWLPGPVCFCFDWWSLLAGSSPIYLGRWAALLGALVVHAVGINASVVLVGVASVASVASMTREGRRRVWHMSRGYVMRPTGQNGDPRQGP